MFRLCVCAPCAAICGGGAGLYRTHLARFRAVLLFQLFLLLAVALLVVEILDKARGSPWRRVTRSLPGARCNRFRRSQLTLSIRPEDWSMGCMEAY